jgi:hypothetical protein
MPGKSRMNTTTLESNAFDTIEEAEMWNAAVLPANVIQFPGATIEPAEGESAYTLNHGAALTPAQVEHIRKIAGSDRGAVIAAIKQALQKRSGKAWSVTGGKGTAYGWLTIDAPPGRRIQHQRRKADATGHDREDYETYLDADKPFGHITDAERAELAALLGLESIHHQGHSVPASTDYYRVALCQALYGHAGPFTAEQYWD